MQDKWRNLLRASSEWKFNNKEVNFLFSFSETSIGVLILNVMWYLHKVIFVNMLSPVKFSFGVSLCKRSFCDCRLSKMTSLPFDPYRLTWYTECVNWLKFTHTQGNVAQRNHVLTKLVLLSLLAKVKVLLPLVVAEEMYVGRSVLRSKTRCVKTVQ